MQTPPNKEPNDSSKPDDAEPRKKDIIRIPATKCDLERVKELLRYMGYHSNPEQRSEEREEWIRLMRLRIKEDCLKRVQQKRMIETHALSTYIGKRIWNFIYCIDSGGERE